MTPSQELRMLAQKTIKLSGLHEALLRQLRAYKDRNAGEWFDDLSDNELRMYMQFVSYALENP